MPSGRKKLGEQNPSTYCRSCWKYLAPDPLSLTSGKGKQSKASLHYPLTNKEFTTPLGITHITLNSILENWGTSVNSNDGYSQAFCMSCARSLVRTFATQTKLVQNINKSPPGIAVKRFSSGSPSAGRSPLAVLEKKGQGCKPRVRLAVYIPVQVNFSHLRLHSKQIYLKGT